MTLGWKLAIALVLSALWVGMLAVVYHTGKSSGMNEVQTKWNADKQVQQAKADEVRDANAKKAAADAATAATAAEARRQEQDAASAYARSLLLDNDSLQQRYASLLASRRAATGTTTQTSSGPSDQELAGLFAEGRRLVVEGRQRLAECTAEVTERDAWIATLDP